MTTTLDLKHPGKPGTLGAGLLHLDGEFKSKLKEVKGKIPSDLAHKFPGTHIHEQVRYNYGSEPSFWSTLDVS